MGFRTVIIKTRAKLESRLNYLIIRSDRGENKIYLSEINTLIIQSTAVSMTAALLNDLTKENVKIIFCDEKHNPFGELLPYYGVYNSSKRYKIQCGWNPVLKGEIWKIIIRKKISFQAEFLRELGFGEQSELLYSYLPSVEWNDGTNREGFAAKVYFNCILGNHVSRRDGGFLNGCLNYGYAVILSAFNREIVSAGYLTQLGIWHDNEFNEFNLSSDLMEPFRVAVDRIAVTIRKEDTEFKRKLINVLNLKTTIDGKETTCDLAVRQYTRSVLSALETGNVSEIRFPEKFRIEDE